MKRSNTTLQPPLRRAKALQLLHPLLLLLSISLAATPTLAESQSRSQSESELESESESESELQSESESVPESELPPVSAHPKEIEELVILSPPPAALSTLLPPAIMESGRAYNVSEAVVEIPGVTGLKRGAIGLEPVIRGLGWERVPVQVGGLPIMGAGPGRMDTPAALMGPAAVQEVEVFKGLPSVTLGPGGTGGRIAIRTDYERPANSGNEIHGRAQGTYGSAGNDFNGNAVVEGGTDRLDVHLGVDGRRTGDYESGGGVEVPNSGSSVGGALSLGYRPAEGHRVWASYIDSNYWDVDFPTLPLNARKGWARIANAGYRLRPDDGRSLQEGQLRLGLSFAEHWMTNEGKPNPMMPSMMVESKGEADSIYTAFDTDWELTEALDLKAGVDFNHVSRDAERTRRMSMMGMPMVFEDHLWPDVYDWNLGFFAEVRGEVAPGLQLRMGGRLDKAEADAKAADDPSLQGRTVRENYVYYHGPDAAKTHKSNVLGAVNAVLEYELPANVGMHLGVGLNTRAPAVTERYFAFANVPGGFQLGNPTLVPEKKTDLEFGLHWRNNRLLVSAQAFYAWVNDYILPSPIAMEDVDGNGSVDNIRSFTNTDARLYGVEASFRLDIWDGLSLPATLAYVRGRNHSDGIDLPEMPPFEANVALRYEWDRETLVPWWMEFGGRFAASQTHVDERFMGLMGENETPAFQVFHLRAGVEPLHGLHFELGVENLFDEDYNEHLTKEAPVPSGDLKRGDEVPEPGRFVYVTLRYEF